MFIKKNLRFLLIAGMILVAAMSRLLPHPPNFTPIGGMALFGAAYFSKKYWALLIPLIGLWISDLVLNNIVYSAYYDGFVWMGMPIVYAAILLIVVFGQGFLKKITLENTILASLIASTIFFLTTNLGSWWMNPIYPKTWVGVMEAYIAGIPFFLNTISGDLFFTSVLFGGFHLLKERFPSLSLQAV